MGRVKSVADTVLGEAGTGTLSQRYNDMRHIASVISNRAATLGVSMQDVVSAPGQFSAFGKSLPPGAAKYRSLAQQAVEDTINFGPVTPAEFYATPTAVDNLPPGLSKVTSTKSHQYFTDPRPRSIMTAKGWVAPSTEVRSQIAAQVDGVAPKVDTATARLAAQDRAAAIAARDIEARTAPVAPASSINATTASVAQSAPSLSAANVAPAATQVSAPAASIDAGSMPSVSISKTSRMSAPAATTAAPATAQRSTVSAPSADARSAAMAQARDSLNAQRAQYSGPEAQAPSTAGNTVSRSAAMSSGFSSAAGAGKGTGTTGGGGWGDDNSGGGFFGGLMDSIGSGLSSPVGTGANLTGKVSAPSVSATAKGAVGSTAGQGATASASLNGADAMYSGRFGDAAVSTSGVVNPGISDMASLGDMSSQQKAQYAGALRDQKNAIRGTVDDATASVTAQTATNKTTPTQAATVSAPTATAAIDSVTPSYKAPSAVTAYADDDTTSVAPAASVSPSATGATRSRSTVSAPTKSKGPDNPYGGFTGLSQSELNAPDASSPASIGIGPRAATMAGSFLGSMLGGPFGGILGAIAGNAIGSAGRPAGGTGGLFGGLFGGSRSGDGLGGAGPGGRDSSGGSRSGSSGSVGGDREKGRRS